MSGKHCERPQRSLTELIGNCLKKTKPVQIEDDSLRRARLSNPRYSYHLYPQRMSEVTTFHALNRELACAAMDQHTGTYSRQKVSGTGLLCRSM